MSRLFLLFISLASIIASFFTGYYFAESRNTESSQSTNKNLQVSVDIKKEVVNIEKTDPNIRVIVNGNTIEGTG